MKIEKIPIIDNCRFALGFSVWKYKKFNCTNLYLGKLLIQIIKQKNKKRLDF